ncbi:GAF domain-containing sensor histidine kinase [Candidatus Cyanaurora vandensis]|uniref:sensor histidine kinase n=1 Tax=Candidatus Cyanaurora vandensis TaxID=2714958 RepID=UPI002579B4A5|nr:GAF domain-containing sensor histidine kinase [Candidatus Cyanaurora vandensis]
MFQTAVTETRQLLHADRVLIYQFNEEYLGTVVAESVGLAWTAALGAKIIDTCFQKSRGSQYSNGYITPINNIYQAGLTACHLELLERFEVCANLVVPIFRDQRVWGLLITHQCAGPRIWTEAEVNRLYQIATQLTIAIQQSETVSLLKERQAREERDRLLMVVNKIRQVLDLEQVLKTTVVEVHKLLQAERVAIYQFQKDWSGAFVAESVAPGWLSWLGQDNLPLNRNIEQCSARILGRGWADTYLQSTGGGPFQQESFRVAEDIYTMDFAPCHIEMLEQFQVRAYLIVAIIKNQKLWGLLAVYQCSGPRVWEEAEINLTYQVATQLTVALQQAELYQASQAQVVELERLARLKDDFISTVSHELRTPVSNMKLAIHMLKQAKSEARRQSYVQILEGECDREIALIQDLLDLQRLDTYAHPLALNSLDLTPWLEQLAAPFQERVQEHQQQLMLKLASNLPQLCTEVQSLERVLVELLNNACKYTPARQSITLEVGLEETHLIFAITNTGVEIPAAELARVFDKFYRIPNNDPWRQPGTGLGLALVRQLTLRLGGQVQAESTDNQTTFRVRLPSNQL